jgi:hypothetical protein
MFNHIYKKPVAKNELWASSGKEIVVLVVNHPL